MPIRTGWCRRRAVNAVPLGKRFDSFHVPPIRGCSSPAERKSATLEVRVRFPASAPLRLDSSAVERHVEGVRVGGSTPSSGTTTGESRGLQVILARSLRRVRLPVSPPSRSARRASSRQSGEGRTTTPSRTLVGKAGGLQVIFARSPCRVRLPVTPPFPGRPTAGHPVVTRRMQVRILPWEPIRAGSRARLRTGHP